MELSSLESDHTSRFLGSGSHQSEGVVCRLRLKLSTLVKKKYISTYFSKRFLFTFLTFYGTALCLVAMHSYQWAGDITYLGGILSSTFVTFHFGAWLDSSWKILHSIAVGALLGICVSRFYTNSVAFGFMFFIAMVVVNKCSNYERLGRVIASIGILMGGLDPLVNPNSEDTMSYLITLYVRILADTIMPFLFVGFTLLLPFPMLAYFEAQARISILCIDMSTCFGCLMKAFTSSESVDLLRNMSEFLFKEMDENMEALNSLASFVELEERYMSPVFLIIEKIVACFSGKTSQFQRKKINFVAFLKQYIALAKPLVQELRTLDCSFDKIQFNKTQAKFADHMSNSLFDVASDINELLNLIIHETNQFTIISNNDTGAGTGHRTDSQYSDRTTTATISSKFLSLFYNSMLSDQQIISLQEKWSTYLNSHKSDLSNVFDSSNISHNDFVGNARDADEGDIERGRGQSGSNNDDAGNAELVSDSEEQSAFYHSYSRLASHLEASAINLLEAFQEARRQAVWINDKSNNNSNENNGNSNGYNENTSVLEILDESIKNNDGITSTKLSDYRLENMSLSTVNLFPRGAFLHRTLKIKELVCGFHVKLNGSKPYDHSDMLNIIHNTSKITIETFVWLVGYFKTAAVEVASIASSAVLVMWYAFKLVFLICGCARFGCSGSIDISRSHLNQYAKRFVTVGFPYMQPIKIGGAVTISTLFMTQLSTRDEMWANAFWVTVVIVLVRNETIASSFFQGFQRVEGTVIGAIYAFFIYNSLNCGTKAETCSWRNTTFALIFWVGFCASFRDSKSHFYAAQVAGITPIILFLGPTPADMNGAWNRVMMTLIGVALYLCIDNIIAPVRIGETVQTGIVSCLAKTAGLVKQLSEGIGVVVETVSDTDDVVSIERLNELEIDCQSSTSHLDIDSKRTDDNLQSPTVEEDASTSIALLDQKDKSADIVKYVASTAETLTSAVAIEATVKKLKDVLRLAPFEPELWHRPFHVERYSALLEAFSVVATNGISCIKAIQSFHEVINAEMQKDLDESLSTPGTASFRRQQKLFGHMFLESSTGLSNSTISSSMFLKDAIVHLQLICTRCAHAVKEAATAQLDPRGLDSETNPFRKLVTIYRESESLLDTIQNSFRKIYTKSAGGGIKSPLFLIAFQNVFEITLAYVMSLSKLGKVLHHIRSQEMISTA